MELQDVAQKDSALKFLKNVIGREIVLAHVESVDPPDEEVLLQWA